MFIQVHSHKKGEYLLIASILKLNVHLDSLSPVPASSWNMGRQRIKRKEMANEESQYEPSKPNGACAHSLPWSQFRSQEKTLIKASCVTGSWIPPGLICLSLCYLQMLSISHTKSTLLI